MNKVLIIRLSSIGDIVLTTPVLRCIKNQFNDNVEIHYLIKKKYSEIMSYNPHLSKIIEFDNNLDEISAIIKKEKYTFIIDLHNNLRTCLLQYKVGQKFYRYPKKNIRKFLLVNFKINLMPNEHVVDRYFRAVLPMGVVNDFRGLEYYISDEDYFSVCNLPKVFQNGYIVWVNGAAHNTKIIPPYKAKEVISKIDIPFIIVGGEKDFESAEEIRKVAPERILNLCGKLSINKSASVIQQSRLVVTPDTGMMHIAAAFRKPIVSVWGNTVKYFGMYPYVPENINLYVIVENNNLHCRPCSKLGFNKCPMLHFNCMNLINSDEIVFYIEKFLKS